MYKESDVFTLEVFKKITDGYDNAYTGDGFCSFSFGYHKHFEDVDYFIDFRFDTKDKKLVVTNSKMDSDDFIREEIANDYDIEYEEMFKIIEYTDNEELSGNIVDGYEESLGTDWYFDCLYEGDKFVYVLIDKTNSSDGIDISLDFRINTTKFMQDHLDKDLYEIKDLLSIGLLKKYSVEIYPNVVFV